MEHFSVLMSVYIREQAALLDRALQSILVNQSVKPSELIFVKLPQNGGLGNALNAGDETMSV